MWNKMLFKGLYKQAGEKPRQKALINVPSALARWWRPFLERSLTTDEVISLAEGVRAAHGKRLPLSPDEETAARQAWIAVWGRGTDLDLHRLRSMFGPKRDSWRQILEVNK